MALFKRKLPTIPVSADWAKPHVLALPNLPRLAAAMNRPQFLDRMRLASERASSDAVRKAVLPAFRVFEAVLGSRLGTGLPDMGVALSNGYAIATLDATPPQVVCSRDAWETLSHLSWTLPQERAMSDSEAFWFSYAMRAGFYLGCVGPGGAADIDTALREHIDWENARRHT